MSNKEYRISSRRFFVGKRVLVMGLGRFGGGVDAAKFAADAGAKVTVTDLASAEQLADSLKQLEGLADIEYHLGSHEKKDFEQADVIVVNPAVAGDNEFVEFARRCNKFVTSQIEIFFQLCSAPIIGVTGANGKSTTAALIAHLLRNTKDEGRGTRDERRQKSKDRSQVSSIKEVWLSGNIGNEPLLVEIDRIGPDDLVELELSSFQLEQLSRIKKAPKVAVLTNLTPNHLDRHGTFENYCAAKENIFKFQELDEDYPAVSVFNAEDEIGAEWFEKYREDAGRVCIKFSTDDVSEEIRREFALPGRANLSNLAAAIAVARYFGVDDDAIKSCLSEFRPLPHRLELVAQINGVSWYNDSNATTPESAIAALEAFRQPVIVIAGGYDKNLSFDKLGEKIAQKTKAAILIGQTAGKIADSINNSKLNRATQVQFSDSLQQAVELANNLAQAGDVVLLSPACASYDMFDNFQHRGREFTRLVQRLWE